MTEITMSKWEIVVLLLIIGIGIEGVLIVLQNHKASKMRLEMFRRIEKSLFSNG